MRKHLLCSLFLLALSPVFAQKKTGNAPAKSTIADTLNLSDALSKKRIAITAEGMGGYHGESIKLICRNLRDQVLHIRIPQGQLMQPADSSMQILVVSVAQILDLNGKTPAETRLMTFCIQAGNRSPISGTAFAVGAMAPENLCQLLKYLSVNNKTEHPGAQSAVWAITNGRGLAGIGDPGITRFTADLLGKEVPGYQVKYESREAPGERAELGRAMLVESQFQYTLTKSEYLNTVLLNAEGKQVKMLHEHELSRAGEHRRGLHLEAWNLTPGKYTVRVQTEDGRVIQDINVEF